ncbi:MAG: RNA polymerase sigma-70 factor (ECF subfamily) [Verrucomicrobiales bacterium]
MTASTVLLSSGARLVDVQEDSQHLDERALVARAGTDPNAFGELYRNYLPRIYDFAYRRTGSVEAAEDICAATFESALRSLDRFRWGSGGFAPWLFRIASRQTISHYRRESRVVSDRGQRAAASLTSGDAPGADELAQLGDFDHERLRTALNSLSERYQRVISLRYLADLDVGDAATAMGMAKPAFSVILTRATAALRRELDRNAQTNERSRT